MKNYQIQKYSSQYQFKVCCDKFFVNNCYFGTLLRKTIYASNLGQFLHLGLNSVFPCGNILTQEIFLRSLIISSWFQLLIICHLGFVVGVACSSYLNIWLYFPYRIFSTSNYRVSFGEATYLYLLYYGPNYNA